MKKIFTLICAGLMLAAFSCNEEEDLVTDGAKTGGLITATAASLNYVVGNPEGPYTIEFLVQQGRAKTKQIKLYKSFTTVETYLDEVEGEEVEVDTTFTSNEVLDRTVDVSNDGYHMVTVNYTLDQLVEGLKINSMSGPNNDLPTDDTEYQIGDRWNFRVVTVTDEGREVEQNYQVGISVSTRYAGRYRAVAAEYYRLGVLTYGVGDWPTVTTIESVDATTYRVVDYFGAAAFTGNTWYFQIDPETLEITYPAETPEGDAQTGNGMPFITCQSNPADLAIVHCNESNYVVNDDVNGKDRLIMSFGYNTTTGATGPRVFYQVLEKIVE